MADAEEHCRRTGISLARLSTVVANNSHFFERLAAGGDCTTGTYERFQAYFDAARRRNAGRRDDKHLFDRRNRKTDKRH